MVNKFEDFDSYTDFSPLTTGKKRALFTDAETAGEFSEKKYAKQIRFSIQMFFISKCANIQPKCF